MVKCYLCAEEVITSCMKCARPLCAVHNTVVHGSHWCHPCLNRKRSNTVSFWMILFGIAFVLVFGVLLLPLTIYNLSMGYIYFIGGLIFAIIMSTIGTFLLVFGLIKRIKR